MKSFQKENLLIPGLIILLVVLAYGLLTPWLGYYWDDWPFAWFLRFFGSSEFIEVFKPFRPLLGPIFSGTTSILGGHPFVWQIAGLVIRFLASLELWFLLRLIWPLQKRNSLWVVLLFTVYPGFEQQWVALTHINQEWIPLIFLFASFGMTALALRDKQRRMQITLAALGLQALGLFTTEYFFGLAIINSSQFRKLGLILSSKAKL